MHVGHRYAFQGLFHRYGLALVAAEAEVPGGWHHHLVVTDLLVLDVDPVTQGTAGALFNAIPVPLTGVGVC